MMPDVWSFTLYAVVSLLILLGSVVSLGNRSGEAPPAEKGQVSAVLLGVFAAAGGTGLVDSLVRLFGPGS